MSKNYLLIVFLCFCFLVTHSQTKKDSTSNVIKTASDIKSGNSQDVLTSFFQLALKDINTGGSFQFNSSLIAFRAKANPSLLVDTNYLKQAFSRNFNFGISASLDPNHQFKDAAINLKYALINNRDKTIFYTAGNYPDDINKFEKEKLQIQLKVYMDYIPQHRSDSTIISRYLTSNDTAIQFSNLPDNFKVYFKDLLKNNPVYKDIPAEKYKTHLKNLYESDINNFGNKALWTLAGSYSYNKKTTIQTEFLKGLVNPKKNMGLELDIVGGFSSNDTLVNAINISRQAVTGSLGLNWVIAKNMANQSIVEFKASASYKYIAAGLTANENNNVLMANGTLRIRITNTLWIPIDIKYDPKAGKIFGFLNVITNFDSIRKLL